MSVSAGRCYLCCSSINILPDGLIDYNSTLVPFLWVKRIEVQVQVNINVPGEFIDRQGVSVA